MAGAGLLVTPTPVPVVAPVSELTPVALPLEVMLVEPVPGLPDGVMELPVSTPALCANAGAPASMVATRIKGLSFIMRRLLD
jgi:hypothetical protein